MADVARSILAACEIINGWSSGTGDDTDEAARDAARHIRERLDAWCQSMKGGTARVAAHRRYDAAVRELALAALDIHVARSIEDKESET